MKRRKFISIAVCLCLLIAMIPQMAMAAEADQPAEPAEKPTAAQPAETPSDSADTSTVTQPPSTPSASENSALSESKPVVKETQNTDSGKQEPAAESTPDLVPTDQQQAPTEPTAPPASEQNAVQTEAENTPADESAPVKAKASLMAKPAAATESAEPEEQPRAAKGQAQAEEPQTIATVKSTAAGIQVSGGLEGKDWTYDAKEQTLTIMKDGMTVSGTATDDLAILCTLAVTAITIDNLDHGSNFIALMSGDMEGEALSDLTIRIKGKNRIDAIIGVGDVTLTGTKNSRLDLTLGAMAFNDLNIKDATINGGSFMAVRDLNIKGKSVVTAKSNKYLPPGITMAMIMAGRDINIDLAKGGKVTAYGYAGSSKYDYEDRAFPFMAGRSINISKGSHVATPSGGKVGTYNLLGMLPMQVILDASGNPAVDASIQYGANKFLTASASVSDVSGSPQTGDSSAAELTVLYLILLAALAAGASALTIRRKGTDEL
ncbi:hypothetical protein NE619_16990 [Anaerovorax odorimutans]|uniref:Uncharacterized protein n=1 Tax=Anaerovorax odorimutans TaxID=109327 RepID=A0ABT1RT93_9FIRM|nr:hypothetical protein [Anaerovorax odorimutans]MCQ4638429.1 hypothetical protein [Anaerovorax odorimutans]